MQYRPPFSSIFGGSFVCSILRNTATTYTCRVFTADDERVYLGQLMLTTAGEPPTTGQIESAIRESARGLDAATSLSWHMRHENKRAYDLHIAPVIREIPTAGES